MNLYLEEKNKVDLQFKHINFLKESKLKEIKKHLTKVNYLDNNHILVKNEMFDIVNFKKKPIKLIQSHFNFLILSGSFRSNLEKLNNIFDNILVVTPEKLKQLAVMYFPRKKICHNFENLHLCKTLIIIDNLNENINIPKNIENIIVFHPLKIDKETILKYKDMFFKDMGNHNDLLKHVYCLHREEQKD